MNITQEEIKKEFERQVRLCSGIGYVEQFNILFKFWRKISATVSDKFEKFFMNEISKGKSNDL